MVKLPVKFSKTAIPLAAGLLAFFGAWYGWSKGEGENEAIGPIQRDQRREILAGSGRGAASLEEWSKVVAGSSAGDFPNLAKKLMSDPRRSDPTMWGPLLARWSEQDGAGMMDFLQNDVPSSQREKLLELGWFAWGASDPDAAFAVGKTSPISLARQLLIGIAESDPRKAAEYVMQMPDSQMLRYYITHKIVEGAPDLVDGMVASAVYDGGRIGFERAKIDLLAANSPTEAVDYARGLGNLFADPVLMAIECVARLDPEQALVQIEKMPSSRTKAISSVSLAKFWAAKDPQAAVDWIHDSLEGPVRHYALIATAEVLGADDPGRGLDLVFEAGLEPAVNFYDVHGSSVISAESQTIPNPQKTAISLFRRYSQADPEGAKRYLQFEIPAGLRDKFKNLVEP